MRPYLYAVVYTELRLNCLKISDFDFLLLYGAFDFGLWERIQM